MAAKQHTTTINSALAQKLADTDPIGLQILLDQGALNIVNPLIGNSTEETMGHVCALASALEELACDENHSLEGREQIVRFAAGMLYGACHFERTRAQMIGGAA